jgi:transposase
MPRERFEITEQQGQALQRAYRQTKDAATRTRYQAVILYTQAYPVDGICRITGCHRTSLMEWCRKYRQQGVAGLTDHRGGPHRAKLSAAQVDELQRKLELYTPRDLYGPETHTASGQHWTVEDLARGIQQWYGVVWASRSSYHRLLACFGFTYQRTEKVYKSRREQAVSDFEAQVEKN